MLLLLVWEHHVNDYVLHGKKTGVSVIQENISDALNKQNLLHLHFSPLSPL